MVNKRRWKTPQLDSTMPGATPKLKVAVKVVWATHPDRQPISGPVISGPRPQRRRLGVQ